MQSNSPHRIVEYSWSDTDRLTRELAGRLSADGFVPDAIVGILRGGCIPAVHISHLLKVRPLYAVQLQTTVTDEIRAPRVDPRSTGTTHLEALEGLKVLLVDDVINTSTTMRAAVQLVKGYRPSELRSAALVWDKLAPDNLAVLQTASCDYWIESVEAWVVFPWNQ